MIPEPYRVGVFLLGLGVFLGAVIIATVAYSAAGRPDWLRYAMTFSPLLIVLLAALVLGLPWDSIVRLAVLAAALVLLIHLFWTRVVLR